MSERAVLLIVPPQPSSPDPEVLLVVSRRRTGCRARARTRGPLADVAVIRLSDEAGPSMVEGI